MNNRQVPVGGVTTGAAQSSASLQRAYLPLAAAAGLPPLALLLGIWLDITWWSLAGVLVAGAALIGAWALGYIADRRLRALVAQRQALLAQLERAQRMESLGRMAGGVAHDFNNILTVILGNAQLVLHDLETVSGGEEMRDELEDISLAAQRGSRLTSQLLAFSQRQVCTTALTDLNTVVQRTVQVYERMLGKRITFVHQLAPDLWPVRANLQQLEQVLANLVINAHDAMPDGGTLLIRTANRAMADDHVVTMQIRDTGLGMSADVASRAFEPFFTTKELGRGTGLGLAQVYGIATQHGGDVTLTSTPGTGTTVTVELPAQPGAMPLVTSLADIPVSLGQVPIILLAEDEPQVRQLAQRVLAQRGYTVLQAGSGQEALALAAGYDGDIDLLLTDVMMPEMSGTSLASHLAELRPGLSVLYMSGYPRDELAHHGLAADVPHYIEKPFSPDALLDSVARAVER